mmetsp:Transcript_5048/g.13001  ORF Transcript_5048/g.13001 Transcript_5048/m.13001 type:complete len:88 (+) Transcript_5048:168-431(+)
MTLTTVWAILILDGGRCTAAHLRATTGSRSRWVSIASGSRCDSSAPLDLRAADGTRFESVGALSTERNMSARSEHSIDNAVEAHDAL